MSKMELNDIENSLINKRQTINLLLIEDDHVYVSLINEVFKTSEHIDFKIEHTDRLAQGLKILGAKSFDIVLLDLGLPDSQGINTLRSVLKETSNTPIVVFTNMDNEETATISLREGAQDYIPKIELDPRLIIRSIKYAIERKNGKSTEKSLFWSLKMLLQELKL